MSAKVILILADGMRPDAMTSCGHPFVEEMKLLSTYSLNAKAVFPSVTLPCHMSLFHSVEPTRHGTTTNIYMPQVRPVDGIVEVLRYNKKKCAFFITWEELRDLCRPGKLDACDFLNCNNYDNVNEIITARAIKYITEQQPDFVFLYLADTDSMGHRYGWMSPEYMKDAHDSIECVKQVYERFGEDYSIIFLADHGGHDRTHGTDMPEDMTIPLFFMGAEFDKCKVLPEASIKDVAPTIAKLLECEPAKEWEGTSVIG